MVRVLVEESSLQNIADAIRAKTGSSDTFKPSEMDEAIQAIESGGGFDDTVKTFSAVNSQVSAFLTEADSKYTDANYTSVSIVDNYASADKNYDDPTGYNLTLKSTGTIHFVDETDGRYSFSDTATSTSYTAYNLIPNHVYRWYLISDGKTLQDGKLKATGKVRQIYCASEDNCRDIGGWSCDGGTVQYGRLYRGMDPGGHVIDSTLINVLKVSQEVDLQEENSVNANYNLGKSAIGDGVCYYRFPFSAYYKDMLDLDGTVYKLTAECLTKIMESAVNGAVQYYHCSLGSDRTGTMTYLLLGLLGVSASDCDKEYELTALTGSLWGSSLTTRKRTIHPKDMRTYINTLGDNFRDAILHWCYMTKIDIELINAYRKMMIDGTPATLTYDAFIEPETSYTNQITVSTDTDGSVYGFKADMRLNSSGVPEGYSGLYVTGFIPVKTGDIVRLQDVQHRKGASNASNQRISFYDSNKAHLGQGNANYPPSAYVENATYNSANDLAQFTVKGSPAYFRICGQLITKNSIITVNEEIS